MKRIKDKIIQIEKFFEELKDIVPSNIDKYRPNLEKKAACERYAEKIIEAVVDLAFLVIHQKKFKLPEDDIDAFNILCENKFIDNNLAIKLQHAKGMRNIIVHEYGRINDDIVFHSITEELEKDVKEFVKAVSGKD